MDNMTSPKSEGWLSRIAAAHERSLRARQVATTPLRERDRLIYRANQQGVSQTAIANRLGITQQSVSEIIRKQRETLQGTTTGDNNDE